MVQEPRIAIVGGGPAGLMATQAAARAGARATIYEAMPTAGRKFLMAGRSGLNITNAEPVAGFAARYAEAAGWIAPILAAFPPDDARAFCADLGVETFVGSSGRVFPAGMKASPLLRAWLARLANSGIALRPRMRWTGFAATGALTFEGEGGGTTEIDADAVVLALGGASWPRLGSTGAWTSILAARGVGLAPWRPSNCGLHIRWSDAFLRRFEGAPLKPAAFSFGQRRVRGEAVVTRRGLEGGPIYALAAAVGEALRGGAAASLTVDLKPDLTAGQVAERLARRRGRDSLANALRKTLGLAPVAIGLLRETGAAGAPDDLAPRIKALDLPVDAVAGLDRAISSAGGLRLDELDDGLMLKRLPGVFAAGEMLDWDAPTGGYLLQACLATGKRAGESAARWARERAGR